MRATFLALLAALASPGLTRAAIPGPLPVAAKFGDFGHDTFALTWQPGFCGTGGGCRADQPHDALIGLHGLWASRPSVLIRRGVTEQQWWQVGCDELAPHTDAAPVLSAALQARLAAVMPHLKDSLLTHEYDKHVACFGFAPEVFFRTALLMRAVVLLDPFSTWLAAQAGQVIRHADALTEFERDFHTGHPRAVQFQCAADRTGRVVLTQLWITLLPGRLADFPAPETLIDAPIPQDDCPASFTVPGW